MYRYILRYFIKHCYKKCSKPQNCYRLIPPTPIFQDTLDLQIRRKEIIYYQNSLQNELADMLDMLPVAVGQERNAKRRNSTWLC